MTVIGSGFSVDGFGVLVGLFPALAVAYGVVMAGVALVTGWQVLGERKPARYRRGVRVPSEEGNEEGIGVESGGER